MYNLAMVETPTLTQETAPDPFLESLTFELEGTEEIPADSIKVTWMGDLNNYGWTNEPRVNTDTGELCDFWHELTPVEMEKWEYRLIDGVFVPPAAAADAPVNTRYKLKIVIPPLDLVTENQETRRKNMSLDQIYEQIKEKYGASRWVQEGASPYYRDPINESFGRFLESKGINIEPATLDLGEYMSEYTLADFEKYIAAPIINAEHRRTLKDAQFCHSQCLTVAYTFFPDSENRSQKLQAILRAAEIVVDSQEPKTIEDEGKVKDASVYWCVFTTHKQVAQSHYGHHNVRTT